MTGDRGSLTPLVAMVAALVATLAVVTTSLAGAYSVRVQAVTAADAAALAAAVATYPSAGGGDPVSAARRIAAANGALLVACRCRVDPSPRPRVVTVVTEVAVNLPIFGRLRIRAGSRAEFDPLRWLSR